MRKPRIRPRRRLARSKSHRKFKSYLSGFALLIFIITFAAPIIAEEAEGPVAEGPVAEGPVAEGPAEKLVEGIEETATGWVEVPKEIVETSEETNIIEGLTVGAVKGAGEAAVKTTEGAVKAATFYIPEEEKEEEGE